MSISGGSSPILRWRAMCFRPDMPRYLHAAARAGVLAFLAVSAAACSAYRISEPHAEVLHPFAPIPTDFARVCVIRTSRLAQLVTFPTLDNGALVGATRGPTFFCYKAEPGEHTLRIQADEPTVETLHAEGGRSYYLHETIPLFAFIMHCNATWVSEQKARELVDDSTYEVITETPSAERLPDPVPFAKAASR
jgi:hypothetical protein